MPPFQLLAIIIGSLLAGSALAILAVGRFTSRPMRKVWTIWGSWMVLAPLMIAAVFAGRFGMIIFATIFALLAAKEFARATGLYRDWFMTGAIYLAILGCAAACAWPDADLGGLRPGAFDLFSAIPIYAVALILIIPVLRNRTEGQLQSIALATFAFVFIGWGFMHLALLTNAADWQGPAVFLIFAVEICDIAAFTFGRFAGRPAGHPRHHPLRTAISPNKTWEGALGALAVAMALPWILGFALPPSFGVVEKILVSLIIGIAGPLGDLAISVIKRDIGIKDMGAAIPGHGGVLDRIDSLLLAAPLFVRLYHQVEGLR